jgi:hypothetical protein
MYDGLAVIDSGQALIKQQKNELVISSRNV